ncbi:hypothetical protein EYF80_002296 [Liparis tanakae]|uniref:Uncharacterized protein n=1 Tax=Liparis tanakae TaxID=230148 RepID=A0A4Z2JBI1_9TELE|nr:hypothetical protein EYF80_002296 [Liparis tanakae]
MLVVYISTWASPQHCAQLSGAVVGRRGWRAPGSGEGGERLGLERVESAPGLERVESARVITNSQTIRSVPPLFPGPPHPRTLVCSGTADLKSGTLAFGPRRLCAEQEEVEGFLSYRCTQTLLQDQRQRKRRAKNKVVEEKLSGRPAPQEERSLRLVAQKPHGVSTRLSHGNGQRGMRKPDSASSRQASTGWTGGRGSETEERNQPRTHSRRSEDEHAYRPARTTFPMSPHSNEFSSRCHSSEPVTEAVLLLLEWSGRPAQRGGSDQAPSAGRQRTVCNNKSMRVLLGSEGGRGLSARPRNPGGNTNGGHVPPSSSSTGLASSTPRVNMKDRRSQIDYQLQLAHDTRHLLATF